MIVTRQEFKKPDGRSDRESNIVYVPTNSHTPINVKEQIVTFVDKAYLQKATFDTKMTKDPVNLAVKHNAEYYSAENNSSSSKKPFRPKTPNDVFRSTPSKYNFPPRHATTTSFPRLNYDPFCPIVSGKTRSSLNEKNFNRSRNSLNSNGPRQKLNNFYPSRNCLSSVDPRTVQKITQYDGITTNLQSYFTPPTHFVSKSSIPRDPPKSLMELTGLPSGPTRERTLIRSKSISSGLSEGILYFYILV